MKICAVGAKLVCADRHDEGNSCFSFNFPYTPISVVDEFVLILQQLHYLMASCVLVWNYLWTSI